MTKTQAEQALEEFNAANAADGGIQADVDVTTLNKNEIITGDATASPEDKLTLKIDTAEAGVQADADVADKKVSESLQDADLSKLSVKEISELLDKEDKLAAVAPDKPVPPASKPEDTVMVPKPRLDQALERARKAEEQIAFLKGRDSVLSNDAPAAPTTPPVDVQLASIERAIQAVEEKQIAQSDELVQKYEAGEMTLLELRQNERALEKAAKAEMSRLGGFKQELIRAASTPPPEVIEEQLNNDPALARATAELNQANAWLNNIPEDTFQEVVGRATELMNQKYRGRIPLTPAATWEMRQLVVNTAKKWSLDKAYGSATPATPPNPDIQARKDKLELQKKHPPSIAQAGAATLGDEAVIGSYTEKDINRMSDTDLAKALPKSAYEKLLMGGTS